MDPVTMSMLIGGGTSILGGVLGGRASSSAARSQQQMAEAMLRAQRLQEEVYRGTEERAQPFRDILYPQLQGILSGETDLSSLPMYSNIRTPLEQQYSQARRALESRVGPSGAMTRARGQLESARASSVGRIPGELYSAYMGTGLGLAAGRPDLGIQAYGQQAGQAGQMIPFYQRGMELGTSLMAEAGQQFGGTLYDAFLKGTPEAAGAGMNLYQTPGARYDLSGPQYNLRTAYGG